MLSDNIDFFAIGQLQQTLMKAYTVLYKTPQKGTKAKLG